MRRLLLFAAILGLLGLSSAFAASFSVQSEDITSFTTDVSISVPTSTSVAYFLSSADSILPGIMGPNPATDSAVKSKAIDPGTLSSELQTDPTKHHSWQTSPGAVDLVLSGPAALRIYQTGSVGPATAGLFVCATPTAVTSACTRIAGDASSAGTGVPLEPIAFGNLNATVPAGSTLRVVVVNLGTKKWNIQWGYKSNRESRLDLTVATP